MLSPVPSRPQGADGASRAPSTCLALSPRSLLDSASSLTAFPVVARKYLHRTSGESFAAFCLPSLNHLQALPQVPHVLPIPRRWPCRSGYLTASADGRPERQKPQSQTRPSRRGEPFPGELAVVSAEHYFLAHDVLYHLRASSASGDLPRRCVGAQGVEGSECFPWARLARKVLTVPPALQADPHGL